MNSNPTSTSAPRASEVQGAPIPERRVLMSVPHMGGEEQGFVHEAFAANIATVQRAFGPGG